MSNEITLSRLATYLNHESDYTVRLLCKDEVSPRRYLFGILLFDGDKDMWTAKLIDQSLRVCGEEEATATTFAEAKTVLIDMIKDWQTSRPTYYAITHVINGWYIPLSLQRKRPY